MNKLSIIAGQSQTLGNGEFAIILGVQLLSGCASLTACNISFKP